MLTLNDVINSIVTLMHDISENIEVISESANTANELAKKYRGTSHQLTDLSGRLDGIVQRVGIVDQPCLTEILQLSNDPIRPNSNASNNLGSPK